MGCRSQAAHREPRVQLYCAAALVQLPPPFCAHTALPRGRYERGTVAGGHCTAVVDNVVSNLLVRTILKYRQTALPCAVRGPQHGVPALLSCVIYGEVVLLSPGVAALLALPISCQWASLVPVHTFGRQAFHNEGRGAAKSSSDEIGVVRGTFGVRSDAFSAGVGCFFVLVSDWN